MKRTILYIVCISLLYSVAYADQVNKPPIGRQINYAPPLGKNLVGCWLFNDRPYKLGVTKDATLNRNNGTLFADCQRVPGKFGPAIDFDGTGDYISIADDDIFTPALTPFSISAWVYMHDATHFTIVSKGVHNTDGEWLFKTDSSDILYVWFMDESVDNCRIGRSYSVALTSYENTWIHVVATYSGGTTSASVKIYLNAVRSDDADYDLNASSFEAVENLTHAVWIGRYSTVYANGLIDNLMIWRKELTKKEVFQLYIDSFSMFKKKK